MMKLKICLLILTFFVLGIPAFSGEQAGYNLVYNVEVGEYREFLDFAVDFTASSGGYVKFYSDSRIVLKISKTAGSDLKKKLAGKYYIRDERVNRTDYGERLALLKTKLKVKEQTLGRFYSLFDKSNFHQTLAVEKEIGNLIFEIERIKGSINYYRDRMSYTEVVINTGKFVQPVKSVKKSRWSWIKKLGIPGLLGSFTDED